MSFPQFPDSHVNHEITFDEKGHDMFIGWQLEHVSRDKRKLYTTYYKNRLGAVQCTSCNVWLRPKSSKERIDVQLTENCPGCFKPTLILVECHSKMHFHIKSKTGVMNHEGTQTHGKFIPLHFTMETLEKVEERVLEFPAEKPYGLKVGTSPIRVQKPARPVSDIDPNLCNLGTIKRFQRTYLAKNDKLQSPQAALKKEGRRKKSAAEERRERAAKHAERIKENKKRSKQDASEQRSMHNDRIFKHLRLSRISANMLGQSQLNDDGVLGFYNLKSDGNCGWRSASIVVNDNEKHYGIVKLVMKHTLEEEKNLFTPLFGREEHYQYVLAKLSQQDGRVLGKYWFDVLDFPRVLAQAYNRPVIVYSCHPYGVHATTFLPFREPEEDQ
ncbi:hypothetical protein BDC45DRAFT_575440 [Circinella umbellata]|nr:hypothetical protein BDC45DRAFT_575440 [Circinella umbellata]